MRIKDRLQSRNIRTVLMTCMGLPLAAALLLSGNFIFDEARAVFRTAQLGKLMQLADRLGSLVHEQQIERGETSVFLHSHGKELAAELAKQRLATDNIVSELSKTHATLPLSGDTATAMAEILQQIDQRVELRDRVDRQEISVPDAIGYYTNSNAALLAQIARIGSLSQNATATTAVNSFVAFQQAKEHAGLERAVASGGFAAGEFTTDRLLTLQRLIAQQEMAFDFFLTNATPDQRAAFVAMRNLPETQKVWSMRKIAFAYPDTHDLQGLTGKDFFAASTSRINAMRDMESLMSNDIATMVQAQKRASIIGLGVGATATIAVALLLFLAMRTALNCVLDTMASIARSASEMSEGNLEAPLPKGAPQELAAIIIALGRFRDSIVTNRAELARHTSEKAAAEQAAAETRAAQHRAEAERQQAEIAQAEERLTQERHEAREIAKVVNACAQGDFSQRLNTIGKDGVIAEICRGVNKIGEVADHGLSEIREALDRLADGDLSHRMASDLSGVFADIGRVLDEAANKLGGTLTRVSGAAITVNGSAEELATATDDLARRSERNAAMLEETAASLEQMSSSVTSATEAAISAKGFVDQTASRAERGNEIVQNTISQMEEISTASANIEKVLGVIDDIAFQTNLLALNAGVEAARAGEAGRGFAVVASEVRALAQRSSDSACEIAEMIARSSQSVKRGVEMAAESGDALRHIVTDIREVSSAIDQIAATFEETKLGIHEISQATTQLDRTTQQNAAMFEETNAAIQTLDAEAKRLSQEMGNFRLPGQERASDLPRTRVA